MIGEKGEFDLDLILSTFGALGSGIIFTIRLQEHVIRGAGENWGPGPDVIAGAAY